MTSRVVLSLQSLTMLVDSSYNQDGQGSGLELLCALNIPDFLFFERATVASSPDFLFQYLYASCCF